MNENKAPAQGRFLKTLSPLAVWALAFGCSVGWGSFVMPGTTFLPTAGALGAVIGILIGALVMLLIGVSYHFLMNQYPDAGGIFSYTKNVFGYDHGFLASWFLVLVYLAIIWANATAIPLIFRGLAGDLFRVGFIYKVAGYDVYLGEILLSVCAILICGMLCMSGGKLAHGVQTAAAIFLIGAIVIAAALVFLLPGEAAAPTVEPLWSETRKPAVGIVFMIFLAPWAYAGFESVSNSTEEFKFSPKKTFKILAAALAAAAAAYLLLALIGAAALPEGFSSHSEYLSKLGSLSGISGLPVFYAIKTAAGTPGVVLLGVAAAAGILTGLLGNMIAAGRMLSAVARDGLLPAPLGEINRGGAPARAVTIITLISLPIPFFGRAAIGWIIDVNTVGIAVAYAYTCAAAFKKAREMNKKYYTVAAGAGAIVSLAFLFFFLVPKIFELSSLSNESYFMLLIWSVLGFVVFYMIFRTDKKRRMGKSTFVWVVLLLLILFSSFVWLLGESHQAAEAASAEISDLNGASGFTVKSAVGIITGATDKMVRRASVQVVMVLFSVLIIFLIYGTVQKRHSMAEQGKVKAEQSSAAKTNFLSNMSHDIRTPMNAIIGYVTLAKREKGLTPKTAEYLNKIEASSGHPLSLINDVLEMSRIESGKMELMPVPTDLRAVMEETRSMFATQMATKGLDYIVKTDVRDANVLCDANRLNRVLLNLISNAYKFTPAGGSVTVTLAQTGREEENAAYKISVKDTGIGMSPEFAAKVFEAFERERTATVENIQGTGLGTAITKNIVELMGGTIEVFSEKGKGSEFLINVSFPVAAGENEGAEVTQSALSEFAGLKLLLADDDPASLELEKTVFENAGFKVELAENGEEAVEMIAAAKPGEYAAVLMDIEMPVKSGLDATRVIRSLRNSSLAKTPIVALSAKAFSEDIAASLAAGMDGHIAKPLDMRVASEVLSSVLAKSRRENK